MGNLDSVPAGAIGFRLANELEGLLHGISADGVITHDESARLHAWLEENARYTSVQPFGELDEKLTAILADGVVTMDECEDLLWVVRKYTRVNPYFDQLRGGIQVLMGVLTGVAADGVLTEMELAALGTWTEEWQHLRGLWPYDEVCASVRSMIARGRLAAEASYLLELANQFPIAGAEDAPPLLIRGVCAMEPVITFQKRTFVFTGESRKCERRQLCALAAQRGARTSDRVTSDTDYLVVCQGGSQHWAFSCYGRKVEQAYQLRRAGQPLTIVHEADFWDAIAGAPAAIG